MNQQGTPIGAGSGGTKNTSAPAPSISENAGPVASDSLAADSYRNEGGFSENAGAAPSSVKGASSTLANDDTSAARTIPPAPDAEARESQDAWSETSKLKGASGLKYAEGLGGQPDFPGGHNKDGYYGGPSQSTTGATSGSGEDFSTGRSGTTAQGGHSSSGVAADTSGSTTGGPSSRSAGNADSAPSYVGSVTGAFQTRDDMKPKGSGITEGGFDAENAPNASFSTEVGSDQDPGRVAEQRLQRENAQSGFDAAAPRQKGLETSGVGYGNLSTDQQA